MHPAIRVIQDPDIHRTECLPRTAQHRLRGFLRNPQSLSDLPHRHVIAVFPSQRFLPPGRQGRQRRPRQPLFFFPRKRLIRTRSWIHRLRPASGSTSHPRTRCFLRSFLIVSFIIVFAAGRMTIPFPSSRFSRPPSQHPAANPSQPAHQLLLAASKLPNSLNRPHKHLLHHVRCRLSICPYPVQGVLIDTIRMVPVDRRPGLAIPSPQCFEALFQRLAALVSKSAPFPGSGLSLNGCHTPRKSFAENRRDLQFPRMVSPADPRIHKNPSAFPHRGETRTSVGMRSSTRSPQQNGIPEEPLFGHSPFTGALNLSAWGTVTHPGAAKSHTPVCRDTSCTE